MNETAQSQAVIACPLRMRMSPKGIFAGAGSAARPTPLRPES